jgi:hypothetical protein
MNATVETTTAGVESERTRATRELFKAQDATRQALGQVKETSRELREKIDEAKAHIGTPPPRHTPVATDQGVPRLPPAAPLWA